MIWKTVTSNFKNTTEKKWKAVAFSHLWFHSQVEITCLLTVISPYPCLRNTTEIILVGTQDTSVLWLITAGSTSLSECVRTHLVVNDPAHMITQCMLICEWIICSVWYVQVACSLESQCPPLWFWYWNLPQTTRIVFLHHSYPCKCILFPIPHIKAIIFFWLW